MTAEDSTLSSSSMTDRESSKEHLGHPADELEPRLRHTLSNFSRGEPLSDGGECLQLLIEVGATAHVKPLLKTAMLQALRVGKKDLIITCYLLDALMHVVKNDKTGARSHMETALRMSALVSLDRNLDLLRGFVGIEVALLWHDSPEIHAYVTRLNELSDIEADPHTQQALHIWMAEWAVHVRNLPFAEEMLARLPNPDEDLPLRESSWKTMRLHAELERARNNQQLAHDHMARAQSIIKSISQTLPSHLIQPYLKRTTRRRVEERLAKFQSDVQSALNLSSPAIKIGKASSLHLEPVIREILQGILQLSRNGNLKSLIDLILDSMLGFTGAQRGMVALVKNDQVTVDRGRHVGGRVLKSHEMTLSRTIAMEVTREGVPRLIEDAMNDDDLKIHESIQTHHLRSVLCLPLLVEGRARGAITLDHPDEAGVFDPSMVDGMQLLADHAAVAIEHALLLARVTNDRTTGTRTEGLLRERVAKAVDQAQRHGYSCGLLMAGIKGLEAIRDEHGRRTTDHVLREIATRLSKGLTQIHLLSGSSQLVADSEMLGVAGPSVARAQGDHFILYVPNAGPGRMSTIAGQVQERVEASPISHKDVEISVQICLGGASYPEHASSGEDLFNRAEEALDLARKSGDRQLQLAEPLAEEKATD